MHMNFTDRKLTNYLTVNINGAIISVLVLSILSDKLR